MRRLIPVFLVLLIAPSVFAAGEHAATITIEGVTWPLYPAAMKTAPDIPSPYTTDDGIVVVVGFLEEDRTWSIIPVTVKNGAPLNYRKGLIGRGNQLEVDGEDFPTLARTGLHSEEELARTETITGLAVEAITANGRPEHSSWVGFMSRDEDIIGVLTRDNRLVRAMGLTHPDLARELFRLWNIILRHDLRMREAGRPFPCLDWYFYRGRTVHILDTASGKGWQESIFDDGVLGMYHLEFRRDLDPEEKAWLDEHYTSLDEAQMALLVKKLTLIHTGEMVPYYIQRYGFYEGDSSFRADPLALAFIFGLRSIEELDAAFEGKLYEVLTGDAVGLGFTPPPDPSSELRQMFESDQAERAPGASRSTVDADLERRRRVLELLAEGVVQSAEDKFHAAMILNHTSLIFRGEELASRSPENYYLAHRLAAEALSMGHEAARYLAAQTIDRYLVYTAGRQKYGTQRFIDQESGEEVLYWIDPEVTDEERARYGVAPRKTLLEKYPMKERPGSM